MLLRYVYVYGLLTTLCRLLAIKKSSKYYKQDVGENGKDKYSGVIDSQNMYIFKNVLLILLLVTIV